MKSYVPFLSLHYLWFHKVSSGLGILGVTLGVGLVIVVVGVMDGFQTRIKQSFISNTTPVVVKPYYDLDGCYLNLGSADRVPELPGLIEAFRPPACTRESQLRIVRRMLEATLAGHMLPDAQIDTEENYDATARSLISYLSRQPGPGSL